MGRIYTIVKVSAWRKENREREERRAMSQELRAISGEKKNIAGSDLQSELFFF